MSILRFSDDLCLIDLPQKLEGFRKFISAWVYTGDEYTLVIDPGPKSTIPLLVTSLRDMGIRDVDYVLITHIHIDHAGGLGEFLRHFENAKVLVNERGKEHLINPEKLWRGSLKVLGKVAEHYGIIDPVHPERFVDAIDGVEVLYTPGHAVHHQSYIVGDYLFVGEAFGVTHEVWDDVYQRPATPPKFVHEIAMDSVKKLKSVGKKKACMGHFGMLENSLDVAEYAEKQLDLWTDAVFDAICCSSVEDFESVYGIVVHELLNKDPRFSNLEKLDADVRKREEYFIRNSIRGMYEYVKENRI
ncbi:MBL fold metallo-hydrolase [Geoglobus acetivorans]|uniref:Beta-lactamase domain protein n=1 Tax=Geoglobus acetivorans TaxID=565033 RepID=A0A0A7GB68_GEOAI|nr:beta-lactamase domain protein [Geoglobus acetivorans]